MSTMSAEETPEPLSTRTVVSAAEFDRLLVALDQPPQRNETLARAARDRRRFRQPPPP